MRIYLRTHSESLEELEELINKSRFELRRTLSKNAQHT